MNCLRNHKRLHVPDRTYYNCDQCDKKYTQKVNFCSIILWFTSQFWYFQVQLKKHIEIVHMQRRDFICTTCGASFGTNSVLKMHLLSHQDFRAEKCEVRFGISFLIHFYYFHLYHRFAGSVFTLKRSFVGTWSRTLEKETTSVPFASKSSCTLITLSLMCEMFTRRIGELGWNNTVANTAAQNSSSHKSSTSTWATYIKLSSLKAKSSRRKFTTLKKRRSTKSTQKSTHFLWFNGKFCWWVLTFFSSNILEDFKCTLCINCYQDEVLFWIKIIRNFPCRHFVCVHLHFFLSAWSSDPVLGKIMILGQGS